MKTTVKKLAICALVVGAFCFGKSLNSDKDFEFPELNSAKRNLLQAKTNLQNAAKDFGGHRQKAIEHLDKSVSEIDAAISYGDKK